MDKLLVHDRVGVHGQSVPIDSNSLIDIPEELYQELEDLQRHISELNNARLELGRLMQVVQHLTHVCNTEEKSSADIKKKIIDQLGLGEGNYAIDFETRQVGLVLPAQKEMPRVV